MSADILRRAAETLRERAGAATHGDDEGGWSPPWIAEPQGDSPTALWEIYAEHYGTQVAINVGRAEAAYIATMSPPVGLALADWLDVTARDLRHLAGLSGCLERTSKRPNAIGECPTCKALAVARAVLGGDA